MQVVDGSSASASIETGLEEHVLATGTTDVLVFVEALPKLVNACSGGFCADVEQDADVRLQERTECVEEPTMRVELLLVLLLQAENNLYRTRSL